MSKALTLGVTIHVDRDTHIDHRRLVTDVTDGSGGIPFVVTHIGEGLACASIFYDDWQHLADVANDMLNAARVHLGDTDDTTTVAQLKDVVANHPRYQ